MTYTFGDNEEASRRLRRLAEIYELETRTLLNFVGAERNGTRCELALDLGCGPGWSTLMIETVLRPKRTVGLEASETYVAEARVNQPHLEFVHHDILAAPLPFDNADFLFCRFLLTHLPSPHSALQTWASAAKPGALIAIHETEALQSTHTALSRYYEMVAEMQKHYGQQLHVGALLTDAFTNTPWKLVHNESLILEKSAREMAQLHLANLHTWSRDSFAARHFDKQEMEQLETQLMSIASGAIDAGVVYNTARQIIAQRA